MRAALLGAASVGSTLRTHYVSLAGKAITPCDGCAACIERGECIFDDDMKPLYPLLLAADAIIVGSPVYFGTPPALCKAFLERVEGLGIGEKRLRLKVGGAIAVGGSRNGGQETTIQAINAWFHVNEMLPVGIVAPVAQWGATATSGHQSGDISKDRFRLPTVDREVSSLEVAWMYGRKIAIVAAVVKAGLSNSKLAEDLDGPYGWELPEFPAGLWEGDTFAGPAEGATAGPG